LNHLPAAGSQEQRWQQLQEAYQHVTSSTPEALLRPLAKQVRNVFINCDGAASSLANAHFILPQSFTVKLM
jgi:hypothetical protein